MDAWTPSEVFVSSRPCTRVLTLLIRWEDRDTQIMQMAMLMRALAFPLASTGPVSAQVMRGMMRPTIVTARDAATMQTMSFRDTQRFIYKSRSEMPKLLSGSGR